MWIVKALFYLALAIIVAIFLAINSNQSVDIRLFFGQEYLGVGLQWVLLAAFLVGFAACLVVMAVRELQIHGEIRGLRRTIQAREKEIVELRTLPLQDFAPLTTPERRDG